MGELRVPRWPIRRELNARGVLVMLLKTHCLKESAMRLATALLVGLLLLTAPTASRAQYDLIAVFSDTTHTDCAVTYTCFDEDCGFILFWVFHYSTSGAQGSRFKAPYQYCLAEHGWSGDYRPFPGTTGNTQIGVTIPYGSCLSGWIHVLTVWYWSCCHIGTGSCCEYPILPHPEAATGDVEALNCTGSWVSADNASAFVNANSSCPCAVPTGITDHVTTWGAVKALFGE